jgi:hypothetical protein
MKGNAYEITVQYLVASHCQSMARCAVLAARSRR